MQTLIPELNGDSGRVLRIPDQLDVPVTDRILRLIDSPQMQRLRSVSQLGLVSQVYPGATHSRFEHSLGVYSLATRVLSQLLSADKQLRDSLDGATAEAFLVAALLHDVAHWPYCHPIEDMQLPWVPAHESLARQIICDSSITPLIERDWSVSPDRIAEFLAPTAPCESRPEMVLRNVLSGPVDVDKMDYLARDSLHAGVPYGRNFDLSRLINSLLVDHHANSLGISPKGKTAAEMMVFSRYVMFSEVYWHHAVRSATAMLQRCVFEGRDQLRESSQSGHLWASAVDSQFDEQLLAVCGGTAAKQLSEMLFGRSRHLFKRVGEYNYAEAPEVHSALRPLPYNGLVAVAGNLATRLGPYFEQPLSATDVLIDAPPVQLEVQFRLNVVDCQGSQPLGDLSPVVSALATKQFDSFVKKVRVFVNPLVARTREIESRQLEEHLLASVAAASS